MSGFQRKLFAAALLALSAASRAATPLEIDTSIKIAKDYLYSKQTSGHWEKSPARDPEAKPYAMDGGQWGWNSAVATYALLAGGESREDPRIKQAVAFLLKADMQGTCAIGTRANVWNLLPKTPEVKQAMLKDMQALKNGLKTSGPARGFYDYLIPPEKGNHFDHRISQYGVDGLWACAQNLEGVPADMWLMIDKAWRDNQHDTGGWSTYENSNQKNPDSVGMSAAGVATLFVAQDFISRSKSLDPKGNGTDPNIDRGIKWIAENYRSLFDKGPASPHPPYGLYCVERIGAASGRKYLGDVNWYDDGADFLVKNQAKNGGFNGVIDTGFAILFLARGRSAVAVNKLQYEIGEKDGNWNQRPRDAANVTKFIGRQIEKQTNWQIVNLKAPVEELHDAPILYISGNQALSFSDEPKAKLKQFVNEGGLILAQADAASSLFANSVKKLGTELFPYEFRPLPSTHVIYNNEQFPAEKWKRKPTVLALSNGVRELIILMPDGDPARYWQAYDIGSHAELFEFMSDVFLYSVDKQLSRSKGETYLVKRDEKANPKLSLKVGRVKYDGNWDPEPAGWPRLATIMNNLKVAQLSTQTIELNKLSASDVKIAHLCGTSAVKFDAAARASIKSFIEGGGVLIVDAAGGSSQFATAIEQEFDAIFADAAKPLKEALPTDHAIYSKAGKFEIAYRPFTRRVISGELRGGRLRMMQRNGKPAVIYSSEDLTAGLVGQPVDGIVGYDPRTAANLMASVLIYAAEGK